MPTLRPAFVVRFGAWLLGLAVLPRPIARFALWLAGSLSLRAWLRSLF